MIDRIVKVFTLVPSIWKKARRFFKSFYHLGKFSHEEINLIYTDLPPPKYEYDFTIKDNDRDCFSIKSCAPVSELNGLSRIFSALQELEYKINFSPASSYNNDTQHDTISLGLGNNVSKYCLKSAGINASQTKITIDKYDISHTKCGLILRYKNGKENLPTKIVCAGISEDGTLHAASFFAYQSNSIVKMIKRNYFHWYQFVYFKKIPDFVALVDGNTTDSLKIIALWILEEIAGGTRFHRIYPESDNEIQFLTEKCNCESSSSAIPYSTTDSIINSNNTIFNDSIPSAKQVHHRFPKR